MSYTNNGPAPYPPDAVIGERWFAYSKDGGIEIFKTADEAKDRAVELLAEDRDFARANREWSEDAESICWGRLHGESRECRADAYGVDYEITEV